MKRLWGGRFTGQAGESLQNYWNSISFDWQLAPYDIQGSIAHVSMLSISRIIGQSDAELIIKGLKEIREEIENGTLSYSLSDEDVHMNIERILAERIGEIAGKLHTARSRNDQVALDMHLYVREVSLATIELIIGLQKSLIEQATKNSNAIMPGYTHLQRAQPILLAHHLLAYVAMLNRDISRFQDVFKRVNVCPLGAGALAGTTFPIDRQLVADFLNFDSIYENSMDAVSDRDFVVEFLSAASLLMMHLSRLSEEVILWTTSEFGFASLSDSYSTGSSMMPQKKNPDLAELVRGKTGRVYGSLLSILTILKGLPLTYNKDMQEDKEGLFDTVKNVHGALEHFAGMVSSIQFNVERMRAAASSNYTNATDLADYLAKKGMPFRKAHEVVGSMVLMCISEKKELHQLSLEELRTFSDIFEKDVYQALDVDNIVNARTSLGGTSKDSVANQLTNINQLISEHEKWMRAQTERIRKK